MAFTELHTCTARLTWQGIQKTRSREMNMNIFLFSASIRSPETSALYDETNYLTIYYSESL